MANPPRFYVPPNQVNGQRVALPADVVQHAIKTLRLKVGDGLSLFDGEGREYHATLSRGKNHQYEAEIRQELFPEREPKVHYVLYQAPLKKERWEWLIEKATELGVSTIVPLITKYVEGAILEGFAKKKARWNSIIQSACEQSGRTLLPKILSPKTFTAAVKEVKKPSFLFYEGKDGVPVKSALANAHDQVTLFIGPTGGFSPEEITLARSMEIPIVTLGKLTFRAETAGIAALAILTSWYNS